MNNNNTNNINIGPYNNKTEIPYDSKKKYK